MNDEYVNVVGITFKKYGKKYYFDCHNLNLRKNLTVIVETERGLQFGTVITDIIKMDKKNIHYPLKSVIRVSTKKDYTNHLNNIKDAKNAYKKCNELIKKYNLDIPVFGMVKNDKHQTRALMDENRNELKISQNLKNLITKFQDTVHDTAIQYHRKLRDKEITKSELDNINGIGNIKKQALLKKFGSVEKIKKANVQEIMEVDGINESLAKKILENL